MPSVLRAESPSSIAEAAAVLRDAGEAGAGVRMRGGATKLSWGTPAGAAEVELSTAGLDGLVEHNAGDLTAVLGAGTAVARAQAAFGEAGQMLPLDPPLGQDDAATIGGVVATGDSGPLRHRYGGARDLLLGMTVVLSDGTTARAGGKVIKNVAGYDLAKLFSGSFGTLGLIAEVVVRLRPRPAATVTAVGETGDPRSAQRAAVALAHAPLEPECLDVFWSSGRGEIAARVAGVAPDATAKQAVALLESEGLDARVEADDEALWARQRAAQRSASGVVVRVSSQPTRLAEVAAAADEFAVALVGRAGLGLYWLTLEGADDLPARVDALRRRLHPDPCVVQDAPERARDSLDVWHEASGVPLELMRRIKARFDPAGVCNPGIFVGGI
jgi:glycolate oxidase FAD binding subunit